MIKKVTFEEFEKVYLDVVEGVLVHYTTEMQQEMSQHCVDWGPESFDFSVYLQSSAKRYYLAYETFLSAESKTICDVGGFWGVFPITLVKLGFDVAMTEALKYYSSAFDELFAYIRTQGVEIIDFDPFEEDASRLHKTFDAISLMAVLEHYPHSPAFVMNNIKKMLNSNGTLCIEVPNIAYWPKRWAFLFGKSPLVSMSSKYHSKTPFIGHHHEYSHEDLCQLMLLADFKVLSENFLNYTRLQPQTPKSWIRSVLNGQILFFVITKMFPKTRELLYMASKAAN